MDFIFVIAVNICISYIYCASGRDRNIFYNIANAEVNQSVWSSIHTNKQTAEFFSSEIKNTLNNESILNGFIFTNRKIKQTSRVQIFGDLPINHKIPEN